MNGERFKKTGIMDGASSEENGEWKTVNGAAVFIADGQSVEDAINEQLRKRSGKRRVDLPKAEYAEFCGAVRTRYADNIPKAGRLLYNDSCYWYTYSKRKEQILCTRKIKIAGNELLIAAVEAKGKNGKDK